jgi:hypothetical protein
MTKLRLLGFLLLTMSAGCQFYFGGGDDDCVGAPLPPARGLRNPQSGTCEYYGGGGGCDGQPVPAAAVEPGVAVDWATCENACSGLDEKTCQASDGCRAIYTDRCSTLGVDCFTQDYAACWATAPSGPIRGGGCTNLGAQACSEHDDCVAVHLLGCSPDDPSCNVPGEFRYCNDEEVTPPPPPPACATLGETACIGRSDCAPLYQGSDCSCTPMGCHCNQETFERCQTDSGPGFPDCGPYLCSSNQYCEHGSGGAYPGMESYACRPLPDACLANPMTLSCSCLQNVQCGNTCAQDPATGTLTVECLYP